MIVKLSIQYTKYSRKPAVESQHWTIFEVNKESNYKKPLLDKVLELYV